MGPVPPDPEDIPPQADRCQAVRTTAPRIQCWQQSVEGSDYCKNHQPTERETREDRTGGPPVTGKAVQLRRQRLQRALNEYRDAQESVEYHREKLMAARERAAEKEDELAEAIEQLDDIAERAQHRLAARGGETGDLFTSE